VPGVVNLGDTAIMTAMRTVMLGILPSGVDVIRAQVNRVPEPASQDFCVITPLRRDRLSTNRSADTDIKLIGSIAGTTLTVTQGPAILAGYDLYGPGVALGSLVTAILPTPGTYTVAPAQSLPAGSKLYAGRHTMQVSQDLVFQADVHGPNSDINAQILATTWRDDAGCELLAAAASPNELQPLYAEEPRQLPFINAESQFETRWSVDLHVQANIEVSLGQEFMEAVHLGMFPVDVFLAASWPPKWNDGVRKWNVGTYTWG